MNARATGYGGDRNGNNPSTGKQTLFRATMNGVFLSLNSLSDSRVWGSRPCYENEQSEKPPYITVGKW